MKFVYYDNLVIVNVYDLGVESNTYSDYECNVGCTVYGICMLASKNDKYLVYKQKSSNKKTETVNAYIKYKKHIDAKINEIDISIKEYSPYSKYR